MPYNAQMWHIRMIYRLKITIINWKNGSNRADRRVVVEIERQFAAVKFFFTESYFGDGCRNADFGYR